MGYSLGNYINAEDIYTEQGLREQVLDYNNWYGLNRTPTSFALFNAMGNIGTVANPELVMNNVTGVARKATVPTSVADITVAAPGSTGTISLDTLTANVLTNATSRVGYAYRINGFTGGANTRQSALILIVAKVGTTLTYKTLWTSSNAAVTFDFNGVGGTTHIHLTDSEDVSGSAPEGTIIYPGQRKNWTQLYRHAYTITEDMESADKLFGNLRMANSLETQDILFGSINHDLLFSGAPLKPGSNESGGAKGTGLELGIMGGLPWLLGCENLSASEAIHHSVSFSACTTAGVIASVAEARLLLNGLYDWSDKFKSVGGTLHGLTSKNMRSLIRQAVAYTGDAVIRGELSLPKLKIYYDELDLGDVKIKLIVDEAISQGSAPYIFDGALNNESNYFMFALDMSTVGLAYRKRADQGIMAPKLVPIGQIRNQYTYSAEWVAELTCGMTRQDRNGVFFLSA